MLIVSFVIGNLCFSQSHKPLTLEERYKQVREIESDTMALDTLHQIVEDATSENSLLFWLKGYNSINTILRRQNQVLDGLHLLDSILHPQTRWREPDNEEERKFLGWLHMRQAQNYNLCNRFFDAKVWYESAIEWLTNAPYKPEGIAEYCILPLANIYTRLGDYEQAEKHMQTARDMAIATSKEKPNIMAKIYSDWGLIYLDLKQADTAINLWQKGLALEGVPDKTRGNLFANLGGIYADLNQVSQAEQFLKQAEEIYTDLTVAQPGYSYNEYQLARIRQELGELYSGAKEYQDAEKSFQEAFDILPQSLTRLKGRDVGKLHISYGYHLLTQQKFDAALSQFQQALEAVLPDYQSTSSHSLPPDSLFYEENTIYEALEGMAEVFRQRYLQTQNPEDLRRALTAYQQIIQVEDLLRQEFSYEASKLFLQSESHARMGKAIQAGYTLYQQTPNPQLLEDLFDLFERNKSLLLWEGLQDAARRKQLIPDTVQLALKQMSFQRQQLTNEWLNTEDSALRDSLNAQRFSLEQRQQRYLDSIATIYPKYYETQFDLSPISLKKAQQQLPQRAVLINYFWAEEGVFAFAVSNEQAKVYQLDSTYVNEAVVTNYQTLLKSRRVNHPGITEFSSISYQLYEGLLSPILNDFDTQHLIFLPDGVLNYVPFESLLTDSFSTPENINPSLLPDQWRILPYLFQQYTTQYAFSVSLLLNQLGPEVANEYLLAGFAPKFAGLETLIYNEAEVSAITELGQGHAYTGVVSKSQFIEVAAKYQLLHLATHGKSNAQESDYSYLLFSKENGEAEKMYVHEIYEQELNNHCTVLSACETGFGRLAMGEGILSLARAFQYAGSRSVIMSLWLADGRTDLWSDFYDNLFDGKPQSEALQMARMKYLQQVSPDQVHPYFWATFIQMGQDEPLEKERSYWMYGVLGLILVLGILGIWRFRLKGN